MKRALCAVMCAALALGACSSDEDGGGSSGSAGSAGSAGQSGAAGSGGAAGNAGSGGSAGASGAAGSAGSGGRQAPEKLSETGLYSDIASETLAPGVEPYQPAFQLWSDGADKRRWLLLPAGTEIDTSDMDFWVYPVGTKVWKEFSRDGTRVETRLLEKVAEPNQWLMMAYHWSDDQSDATAVPDGVSDASGTDHDIPSQADCQQCHEKMKDRLLSVSAIQLSHDGPGVTLDSLAQAGRLSQSPAGELTLPGHATDRAALGYLHANCGVCHNPTSFVQATVDMNLWLSTSALGAVTDTPTYQTTVNKPLSASNPTAGTARIVPGDPEASDVHLRMNERGTLTQMPPLASELVDPTGLGAIEAWIESL